jgi:hypothetical protein
MIKRNQKGARVYFTPDLKGMLLMTLCTPVVININFLEILEEKYYKAQNWHIIL